LRVALARDCGCVAPYGGYITRRGVRAWDINTGGFVRIGQPIARGLFVMDNAVIMYIIIAVFVGVPIVFILFPLTGLAPTLWETWFARVVRKLKKKGGKIAFSFTEIEDGIYLGSLPRCEEDYRSLQELGVGTIVTLNQSWELVFAPVKIDAMGLGLTTCWLKTPDYAAPTQTAIRKGVDAMKQAMANDHKIYVHCNAGRGRSAIVVLCYMIEKHNWTASKTFENVRSKRAIANMKHSPVQRQWNSVLRFERKFRKRISGRSGKINRVVPGIEDSSAHRALKRIADKSEEEAHDKIPTALEAAPEPAELSPRSKLKLPPIPTSPDDC